MKVYEEVTRSEAFQSNIKTLSHLVVWDLFLTKTLLGSQRMNELR